MEQSWRDLLFAHWPYPADDLRAVLPPQLPLDTFEGQAWIGVVPFKIENLRARGMPPLPGLSSFPELNVRTYVTIDDKPGVYFFSLDAANPVAVQAARILFHLNYFNAEMSFATTPDGIEYTSQRTDSRGGSAWFRAHYASDGEVAMSLPGTLQHFLTERYCLYGVDGDGGVHRLQIHHRPWLLQPARAEIDAVELITVTTGLPAPIGEPLLHYSPLQHMIGWPPETL